MGFGLITKPDTGHTFFHRVPLSHLRKHTQNRNMERVYPATPLEAPKGSGEVESPPEHQQLLSPPAPPSYDQATGTPAETTGPAPTPATTTTHHTVVVVPSSPYGPEPMDVQCPHCHNYARTRISYKPNSRTHLIALILCLFQ